MSDITIRRSHQGLLVLSILGAIGAAVAAQLPELQRYLKLRSM